MNLDKWLDESTESIKIINFVLDNLSFKIYKVDSKIDSKNNNKK